MAKSRVLFAMDSPVLAISISYGETNSYYHAWDAAHR